MRPGGARLRLLGDIGGTNARFALQVGGEAPSHVATFACKDYADLADAVRAYLQAEVGEAPPSVAAFAVAAPLTGDRVELTNSPWSFSTEGLRRRLGLERLIVVNDFTATALSIPRLDRDDLVQVGGGAPVAGAPIAVLGPGTGLGVSGLIPGEPGKAPERWVPLTTEGGHVTLAAADDRESAVLAVIRRKFGHASAERALSGPGLVNLAQALAEVEGGGPVPETADQITSQALSGTSPLCAAAVEMFCAMLGTVASNLALTLGARGGVFIAGGIVPKLGTAFTLSSFRRRFEEKGRFSDYLAAIPTYVIVRETVALLGLTSLPDGEDD